MKNPKTTQFLVYALLGLMMGALRFVLADITCCNLLECGGGASVTIGNAGCGGSDGTWSHLGGRCGDSSHSANGRPMMTSKDDVVYATASAGCPVGHCDEGDAVTDDCAEPTLKIEPGATGCKITLITDQCGMKQWKISEPKKSGAVTVTATVTGNCLNNGPGCSVGEVTYTAVGTLEVDLPPEPDGGGPGGGGPGGGGPPCRACGWDRDSSGGSGWVSIGSVDFRLRLGRATPTLDAGYLWLSAETPSADLARPTLLGVPFVRPGVEVLPGTGGVISQVMAPQCLVNVRVINDYEYHLEVFSTNKVTAKDGSGFYGTNGPAFVIWVVKNPDGAAAVNHLNITEQRGGIERTFQYTYTAANARWDLLQPDGRTMVSTYQIRDSGDSSGNTTNYFREAWSGSQLLRKNQKTYEFIPALGNMLLKQEIEGDGTLTRTNTYVYYPSDPSYGASTNQLQRADYWDGKWAYYQYDSLGRVATNYSTYGNNAPPSPGTVPDPALCKVTQYAYSLESAPDDDRLYTYKPRQTIVTVPVGGTPQEISRTYHCVYTTDWEETQECPDPGATWGALGNLRTVTGKDTKGRVVSSLNPDGTGAVYTYPDDYTTIVQTGQPDNSSLPGYIVSGTQTTTVVDELGLVQSVTNQDVVTGVILSSQNYNYKDGQGNYLDPLRRSYDITDLAGRTTQYRYNDCCGLDHVIDPDGVKTYYEYDSQMKWQIGTRQVVAATEAPLIEVTNRVDGLGRVVATLRVGTNGSVITQQQFQYDLLGQIAWETNALNGATAHTNFVSSSGQVIWTNTYPDGGTRVEIYNRDGQRAQVIGTAAHPVRYLYDVEPDCLVYRSYTKGIKLYADGSDSAEWTKTYSDGAGRAYKTAYAPRTGVDDPTSPPCQQTFYNEFGQAWKVADPDNVTSLYTFDGQGRQEYTITVTDSTWVPTDYDSLLAGLDTLKSGSDRITRTRRTIVRGLLGSPDLVRTETYVWQDGQSTGTLVAYSETSTDGLQTWQTTYRDTSTSVTSHSQTAYGGNGTRTVTTAAPDNSYTISAYNNGRLASVTRYDSASPSAQIGSTTYGYDSHGRQSTVTDVRDGTTTYGYNAADLVTSVTTPNPGTPGGAAQTTTTFYNTMLQATNVLNPDGTSVTTEYYLTGELKRQYGSRTYPVGYGYDYAARMTTMTNWSAFASGAGERVTTWNYNPYRGWLDSKQYPDGHGPSYLYTAAGRLQSRAWARTVGGEPLTTTYAYDNAGVLTNISYSDSTPGVTNTYNRLGRLATVACNGITNTLGYNLAGEQLSESYAGGTLDGLCVGSVYDQYLRRTNLTVSTQSATLNSVAYGYDTASRLQTVTDNTAATPYSATYTYVANSPLVSQITFKSNTVTRMTTTKQYDFLNRLTSISSAIGASAIGNSYGCNNANQRIRSTLADGSYWLYEYDSLGQVRSGRKYWPDQTPVAGQQFEYSHDDIGNRAQTKAGGDQNGWNLRTASYGANSLNQYTNRDVPGAVDIMGLGFATNAVTVNGQTAYRKGEYFRAEVPVSNTSDSVWQSVTVHAAGQTDATGNVYVPQAQERFYYDFDGNLTNDGRWTYTWDAENRLVKLAPNTTIGPRNSLKFEYDWQGRRIRKQVWANTSWTDYPTNDVEFVYDGWNLIAELNASNNDVVRSFMWGSDLSGTIRGAGGVGGLLEVSYKGAQTTNCFVAFDGNGNVTALADAGDTNLLAQYEYSPFGELLRATGPMAKANPFRFSTKYQDDETDLLYYGYRYYNGSVGRWISRDPLGEQAALNTLAFLRNDGVNRHEFLGLCACKCKKVKVEPSGRIEAQPNYPSAFIGQPVKITIETEGTDKSQCKCKHLDVGFFYYGTPPHKNDMNKETKLPSCDSYTDQPGFGPYQPFPPGVPWSGQTDDSWHLTYEMRIAVVCEEPGGHAISDSAPVTGDFRFSVTYDYNSVITITP